MDRLYRSMFGDPAKHWEVQDDYRIGCRGCIFNQQYRVQVNNKEWDDWRCGAKRPEYPNGGQGICDWWRK